VRECLAAGLDVATHAMDGQTLRRSLLLATS
jgi:hypothetical protein